MSDTIKAVGDLLDKKMSEQVEQIKNLNQESYNAALKRADALEQEVKLLADQVKQQEEKESAKIEEFQTKLKTLDEALQKGFDQRFSEKSLNEKIEDALIEGKINKDEFGRKNFQIKQITTGDFTTAITNEFSLPLMESGVSKQPTRQAIMGQLVRTTSISTNGVSWVERSGKTGNGPAYKPEEQDSESQQSTYTRNRSAKLEVLASHTEFTRESLEDIPFLVSEIRDELLTDLSLKLDQQIMFGRGEAQNEIQGLYPFAQAFTRVGGAKADPTRFLVLSNAISQIKKRFYNPNAILVDESAYYEMLSAVDGNNNSINANYATLGADGVMRVRGIPIYNNELMTQADYPNAAVEDQFILGDFTRYLTFFRRNIELETFDQHGTNATKQIRLMQVSARLGGRLKSPDQLAFVAAGFQDALADMTA